MLTCVPLAAEAQAERKDGSHPVHVDNCILNAEALVCIKEPPAYTFRDFRCQWSSGPQGLVLDWGLLTSDAILRFLS